MAHQVRIGSLPAATGSVVLPNGVTYTVVNQVVTLTDAQFARIDLADITNGQVVDLGPVYSLGHLVTATSGNVDLPNGITLQSGQSILLDDDSFSKLSGTVLGTSLTDGGAVTAVQSPTVGVTRTFAAHAPMATVESVVKCDATGGAFTQLLPATPIIGRHYVVIKIDASANAITIQPSPGTGTINGAASQSLAAQYNNLDFVWDGTNWFIST
jgi:hypothetical protein